MAFTYPPTLNAATHAPAQSAPGVLGVQAVDDTDFPDGPCKSLLVCDAVSVTIHYNAEGGGYVSIANVGLAVGYHPLYGVAKVSGLAATPERVFPLY